MKGLQAAGRKGDGHIKERLGVHTGDERGQRGEGVERSISDAAGYVGICMRSMQSLPR